MTYSFDIFDTCLVRTCGRPVYVFDILAERILGPDACASLKNDFTYIRINGEQKARQSIINGDCEEVTLDEIYNFCDFTSITNTPADVIKRQELAIEAEVLVPVFNIKSEIDTIHSKGESVLFISDMYLPYEFILKILKDAGLFVENDSLYISSSIKKSKSTGNLYKYVKEDQNINYGQWLHTGDNKHSDYKTPRKLGIRARHIEHRFNAHEREMISLECSRGKLNRHIMASISRACRVTNAPSATIEFASSFIAPLYVPFVYSIMSDAQKRGITDLHFLARDSYIFYNIAKQLAHKFASVNIHYIYASRKSLYLPGLEDIDYDSLSSGLAYIENYTIEDICDRFQLDDKISFFSKYKNVSGTYLLETILKDRIFLEMLRSKRDEQRTLCIEYFKQENLTNGSSAVVDLSGSRKCHLAINKILSSYDFKPVFAYYFDVLNEHIPGKDYYSFFSHYRYYFNKQAIKAPQEVFEQYFSISDHGTTLWYTSKDGVITPVLDVLDSDSDLSSNITRVNIDVCHFFGEHYLRLVDTGLSDMLVCDALRVFTSFKRHPEINLIYALKDLNAGVTNARSKKFIKKQNFIKTILHRDTTMIEATLVYSSFFPRITTALLKLLNLIKLNHEKYV